MERTTLKDLGEAVCAVKLATGQGVDCYPRAAVQGWHLRIGGVSQNLAQGVTLRELVHYLRVYLAGYNDGKAA